MLLRWKVEELLHEIHETALASLMRGCLWLSVRQAAAL